MRLCCVQLFGIGDVRDALTIWKAKKSSYDADASIEIRLLCGAGLNETKAFLEGETPSVAIAALAAISEAELCGDFMGFLVADELEDHQHYYS